MIVVIYTCMFVLLQVSMVVLTTDSRKQPLVFKASIYELRTDLLLVEFRRSKVSQYQGVRLYDIHHFQLFHELSAVQGCTCTLCRKIFNHMILEINRHAHAIDIVHVHVCPLLLQTQCTCVCTCVCTCTSHVHVM